MLSDASAALRALNHYEAPVFNHSEQEDHKQLSCHQLTLAERTAFVYAYYCTLLGQPKIPFESLAYLDMLEYLQMTEATMLLTPWRKRQGRVDLGINFPHIRSPQNEFQKPSSSPSRR